MSNIIVTGKVVKLSTFETPKGQLLISFKVVTEQADDNGEIKAAFTPFSLCYKSIEAGRKFAEALSHVYTATVEATKTVVTQGTKNPEIQFVNNYTTARNIQFVERKTKQA